MLLDLKFILGIIVTYKRVNFHHYKKTETDVNLVFNLGFWEIVIIALVVLLLFGGKKIPELMRGLGKGVKNFKDGIKEVEEEVNEIKKDIDSDK